jgi:drug/metabolite transporter (DMT)-like permease
MSNAGESSDREHVAAVYSCVGSFAYAVTGALAHTLKDQCSWELLSITRGVSMLLFAAGAMVLGGVRPLIWERSLFIRSFAGCVTTFCTFYAWTRLPLADVTTLINTVPIWVALLSGLVLKERTGPGVWVAVLMAFSGVVLIQQPHFGGDYSGVIAALGGGLAGSFSVIGLRRAKHLDVRAVVLHMAVIVTAASLLTFFFRGAHAWVGPEVSGVPWRTVGLLVSLGLFTVLAQFTITRAYSLGRASRVTVLGVLGVFFAAVLDRVLWSRQFEPATLIGMLLVTAPSAWLTTHAARSAWRRRSAVLEGDPEPVAARSA